MSVKKVLIGLVVLCISIIPVSKAFGMQGFYGCFQNFSKHNVTFKVVKSSHVEHVSHMCWDKRFYIKADDWPFSTSYVNVQFYVDGKKYAYFDVKIAYKGSHAELHGIDKSVAPDLVMYTDFARAPGKGSEDYWYVTFGPDESHWMGEIADTLQKIPISEVLLPGSHDSGTFDYDKHCEVSNTDHIPSWVVELLKTADVAPLYEYLADVCRQQDMNFYDQLKHGIRYFDMRICKGRDGKSIKFTHTMEGKITLEEGIDQFKKFFEESGNEKEVILLDFQEMINVDLGRIFNIINSRLGKWLVPKEMGIKARVGDIWAQNKNIILIFQQNYDNPNVWYRHNCFHNSANRTTDVNEAFGNMDNRIKNRNHDEMFCLGTNLTEQPDDLIKGFLNPLGSSPKKAKQIDLHYHYAIHNWLIDHTDDLVKNGNAIHENFSNGIWLTELCKYINTLKAKNYN
ncbi:MAG: hypothetical protein GY750_11370 [Lentisphaerae bacterium]|nr:hypothetical protein [Lentisphaerota bacterium]MCP4102013.1 hypothetical protein [Lentisphaerota bacterium]